MVDYGSIREGTDVFDRDGDKLGTVGAVYTAAAVAGTGSTYGVDTPSASRVMKVDTGFLGLGKDLWIPFSALREVRGDGAYLSADKDDLDAMGWDQRPSWLA
jgi:hypothetical protein